MCLPHMYSHSHLPPPPLPLTTADGRTPNVSVLKGCSTISSKTVKPGATATAANLLTIPKEETQDSDGDLELQKDRQPLELSREY